MWGVTEHSTVGTLLFIPASAEWRDREQAVLSRNDGSLYNFTALKLYHQDFTVYYFYGLLFITVNTALRKYYILSRYLESLNILSIVIIFRRGIDSHYRAIFLILR